MKKIAMSFLVLIIFSSCNQNIDCKKDTVILTITDTIFIERKSQYDERKIRAFYDDYRKFYNKINYSTPNKQFVKSLNDDFWSNALVSGILHSHKTIKDATVLLFLKIYQSNLNGNGYCFYPSYHIDDNTVLALLYLNICQITSFDPADPVSTELIYEWVKNQEVYIENGDIRAVIENIKQLESEGKVAKTY